MKNYKIHFTDPERERVMNIITRSNDIILNQVEPEAAFITIQLGDDEADLLHNELLEQIEREVRRPQTVVVVTEEVIIQHAPPSGADAASRTDRNSDIDRRDHIR